MHQLKRKHCLFPYSSRESVRDFINPESSVTPSVDKNKISIVLRGDDEQEPNEAESLDGTGVIFILLITTVLSYPK